MPIQGCKNKYWESSTWFYFLCKNVNLVFNPTEKYSLCNCKFISLVSPLRRLPNHTSVSVASVVFLVAWWRLRFIVWADLECPWRPSCCFLLALRLFGRLPGDMCHKQHRYSEVKCSSQTPTPSIDKDDNTCHHFVEPCVHPQNGDWSHAPRRS